MRKLRAIAHPTDDEDFAAAVARARRRIKAAEFNVGTLRAALVAAYPRVGVERGVWEGEDCLHAYRNNETDD
jgi:hypothetical protein